MRRIALCSAVVVMVAGSHAISRGAEESAPEEFRAVRWPAMACPVPAMPGVPSKPVPIIASRDMVTRHLASVGGDIMDFYKARSKVYESYAGIVSLTHAHCPTESFDRLMEAHDSAFESWKEDALAHYAPGAIGWASPERLEKLSKGKEELERIDSFRLRAACRPAGGRCPRSRSRSASTRPPRTRATSSRRCPGTPSGSCASSGSSARRIWPC